MRQACFSGRIARLHFARFRKKMRFLKPNWGSGFLAAIAIAVSFNALGQTPSVYQNTSGFCSPAISNVTGNVTIICNGVSPKAMERLNRELQNTRKTVLARKLKRQTNLPRNTTTCRCDLSAQLTFPR